MDGVFVGKYYPEEKHPVSRVLFWLYERPCRLVLRHPKTTIALAAVIVATTVPVYLKLGHEFMPPLNEGSILYMPTTFPGISVTEAQTVDGNAGPHPASSSRKSFRSTAKRAGPIPRPIPRRSR